VACCIDIVIIIIMYRIIYYITVSGVFLIIQEVCIIIFIININELFSPDSR